MNIERDRITMGKEQLNMGKEEIYIGEEQINIENCESFDEKGEVALIHCYLCPFLCVRETQITEHVEKVHKNGKTAQKDQIRCPGCQNVFYHKIPLRAHLIYDHGIPNADVTSVLQFLLNGKKKGLDEVTDFTKESGEGTSESEILTGRRKQSPEKEIASSEKQIRETFSEKEGTCSEIEGTSSQIGGTSSKIEGTSSGIEGASSKIEGASSKIEGASSKIEGASSKMEGSSSKKGNEKTSSQREIERTNSEKEINRLKSENKMGGTNSQTNGIMEKHSESTGGNSKKIVKKEQIERRFIGQKIIETSNSSTDKDNVEPKPIEVVTLPGNLSPKSKGDSAEYSLNANELGRSDSSDLSVDLMSENLEAGSTLQVMRSLVADGEQVNLPTVDTTAAKTETYMKKLVKTRKCYLCKTRMDDADKIIYHMRCHSDSCFKCPECKGLFAFWKPLASHLWRLHKIDMELYACDRCNYKTVSRAKLNNVHKLIHGDVRSYVCETCSKAFKNRKQLSNHQMVHKEKSGDSKCFCDVCAKPFVDRRQLRVHIDGVHKKIKPFLCNYCGYKGSTKGALKMHMRQHTGEKPFSCDACSYSTADHNSLRRHKLRHTGHKPYKCSHCDYACIQSSTYKTHLKTKHPGLEKELLFSCDECQFKTINRDIYCSHLSAAHSRTYMD